MITVALSPGDGIAYAVGGEVVEVIFGKEMKIFEVVSGIKQQVVQKQKLQPRGITCCCAPPAFLKPLS